jgi:hypothetical protein
MAIPERVQQKDIQAPEDKPQDEKDPKPRGVLRTLGLGLITGAADDDPSAIGTYASASVPRSGVFVDLRRRCCCSLCS